jgi:two-component system sensor histidine kinase KdpD
LLHRLERGVVYEREKAQNALQNFFRESSLVALRELTLREAAHEVEHRIASHAPGDSEDLNRSPRRRHHKILALVTADPKTAMVIRRARRVSDFLGAECFAVAVEASGGPGGVLEREREAIEKHLNFARNLHIETRILRGADASTELISFARRNAVTQIFVTRPRGPAWGLLFSKDPAQRIISRAKDMQIVIVSDREPAEQ